MEAKQSNKFRNQKKFLNTLLDWNLSLEKNYNIMVLDHTFSIWIYNIVMFP